MITVVVIGVVIALCVALVVVIAMEPGASPADVAVAYEEAVDRHDARTLWGLVSPELREGRRRHAYLVEQARVLADRPRDRVVAVEVADEFSGRSEASVLTVVHLTDGSSAKRRTRCEKSQGTWRVRSVTDVSDTDVHPEQRP